MSIKVSEWVWAHSQSEGTARLVLLAIADHAHDDGRDAWPSQERLARKCRVSVRTVRRAVDELVALGELEVDEYHGRPPSENGGRWTHRYVIHMLADNLTGNPGEVGGQEREVAGQNDGGLSDTGVRGTVLNRPSEPSARIASKKSEELAARMVDHFGKRYAGECALIVDAALLKHDWHAVDVHIGKAIDAGAQYPSYVANAVGVPSGREARRGRAA